jgi:hypothetical protein
MKLSSVIAAPAVIQEVANDFKNIPLKGKKTKVEMFWEYKLLPATFDIDFGYKINFDKKQVDYHFASADGKMDTGGIYYEVVKPYFSERTILTKAKNIGIPEFVVKYCNYGGDSDLHSINIKRTYVFNFSHTITFEAKDYKKTFTKDQIMKLAQDWVNKAENVLFPDTDFYKITK